MKTSKSIKITSVIQAIYCLYCLVTLLFLIIGANGLISVFSAIGIIMFVGITGDLMIVILPIVCLVINLVFLFKERRDPDQRKIIGLKWIWIIVMSILSIACTIVVCMPFLRL